MFEPGQKIFCVGIGGIGLSGLARILSKKGMRVSGADLEESETTRALVKEGIAVAIGHRKANLPPDTRLVVYSAAVTEANPERRRAKSLNIPQVVYPAAVGSLISSYRVIAVAGTNGKTTTTAMVGTILQAAGYDPTVLVGSKVLAWKSNVLVGTGEYFVLEADEYRRAFLNYAADVGVITNIAADHLDYYRDLADVKNAFAQFIQNIRSGGTLVYNADDPPTRQATKDFFGKRLAFGEAKEADVSLRTFPNLKLKVPGRHNLADAFAAAGAAKAIGVPGQIIQSALGAFAGTWRRFQPIGKVGGTDIISDYAHHPDGVRVTLQTAAEEYKGQKVLAVFQPHQRSRTKKLFKDFVKSFAESPIQDFVISEIFDVPGREDEADRDVSSRDLVREINARGKNVVYAADLADCEREVAKRLTDYGAIIFMGAGDIYKLADKFANVRDAGS